MNPSRIIVAAPEVSHAERPVSTEPRKSSPFLFARRAFLFSSPLLLTVAILEGVLWQTAETWPVRRVIAEQRRNPAALFMRGILDQGFYRYKFLQIQNRNPRVLVLGSSRVMEFRAEMFGVRSNQFFNAGGMIQDLGDLDFYTRTLDGKPVPEVLFLGLDLWWFNGNKTLLDGLRTGIERDAAEDWQEHVRALRRFKSSKTCKAALAALRAINHNLGLVARTALFGFRPDGSMHYNFSTPAGDWRFVDREQPPIPERVRNSSAQFTLTSGVDSGRIALLQKCLERLHSRKVLVLGFLPPFSSETASLLESGALSNFYRQVRTQLPNVFAASGESFLDCSNLSDLAMDDQVMFDGLHAAETFHLHLLARFLQDARVAAAFPGLRSSISAALTSPETNPWHPDYTAFFQPAR